MHTLRVNRAHHPGRIIRVLAASGGSVRNRHWAQVSPILGIGTCGQVGAETGCKLL